MMHRDQLPVDEELVARLLRAQHPELAQLPVTRLDSSGTVNAMFRLGDELVVRMPYVAPADGPAEADLLTRLWPKLSTPIPRVVATGSPDDEYPSHWLVLGWLPGRPPTPGSGSRELAAELLTFLEELRAVDLPGAPPTYRSALTPLNEQVLECLEQSRALLDPVEFSALELCWRDALAATAWDGPTVWTHGDLLPANVLVNDAGHLTAVLDFGAAGPRDPACDLMGVWSLLTPQAQQFAHERHGLGEDAWRRARGWALSQAIIALPYYVDTNPGMVAVARQALSQLSRTYPR
ncbi:MAG: aminoglycoside phosphotransferase family protein [Pseudolysinimonas sp.]